MFKYVTILPKIHITAGGIIAILLFNCQRTTVPPLDLPVTFFESIDNTKSFIGLREFLLTIEYNPGVEKKELAFIVSETEMPPPQVASYSKQSYYLKKNL